MVRLFDPGAAVGGELGDLGTLIVGRFSLRIVLDCAALDAHALLAAAVLAFPVAWRRRIAGVVAGTPIVGAINVIRIVILYVAGVRWPDAFHVLHEEVLQLLIIVSTFLVFAAWIVWARRARPA
jgi:exosortase/archaeosortase family protein